MVLRIFYSKIYIALFCLMSSPPMVFCVVDYKDTKTWTVENIESHLNKIHDHYNNSNKTDWNDKIFKEKTFPNEAYLSKFVTWVCYREFVYLNEEYVHEGEKKDAAFLAKLVTPFFKDVIMKSEHSLSREISVYFLYDYLIGYGEDRNKLLLLDKGDLFDICSSFINDSDINVKRAAYKLFSDYILIGQTRKSIEAPGNNIEDPKFENLFKQGLSDQDRFVQGYASQIKEFFIKKNAQADQKAEAKGLKKGAQI